MTDYVLTGLVKRRAEMAGELEQAHATIAGLVRDLEHIDATIRIVAPGYEPETVSARFRPPDDWSKRGQMSRMILSILRVAKEPLTSREIASRLILQRGLALDDRLLRLMTKRVSTALRERKERGLVAIVGDVAQYHLWEIAV